MRLGLVLAGGGSKGAFEAGVVAAMEERGLVADVLSGTSAGALNAAGLAAGFDAARLGDIWRQVSSGDVYRLRRDLWNLPRPSGLVSGGSFADRLLSSIGWTHLLKTDPLRRTLIGVLGGERIQVTAGRTLVVSAVERDSGALVRFASAAPPAHRLTPRFRVVAPTVDHLLASAAIPLVFEPGTVASTAYWDGGLVANTPLAPALAYEPDAVVVVTTSTRIRPAPAPRNLSEAISLLIDDVLAFSLEADLARAEVVNELCRVAGETPQRRLVDILVIQPTGLELGNGLSFVPSHADALIELGRAVGGDALDAWRARR